MPEGELSFVTVSGNHSQDTRSTNKVVRAHVMRRYKRQQRVEARKRAQIVPASNVETGALLSCGSALSDTVHEASILAIEPVPSSRISLRAPNRGPYSGPSEPAPVEDCDAILVGLQTWFDGNLDPFSSLPIKSTPRSLMLLQLNAASTIRTSVHADPDSLYRQICSKDPAWLFMNMFYAASRFPPDSCSRTSEPTDYLLQAMSAVHDSIAQSPNLISDSIIATVSCLANIENLNGVASDASIHMNGLVRMVESRGGVEHLGMRGILRRMVLWSDLLHSSRSATAPRFRFHSADPFLHLSCYTPSASLSDYRIRTNRNLDSIQTIKHGITISHLLCSLHELSVFLDSLVSRHLPWEASYPDRVYEVEFCILLSLFDDRVNADSDSMVSTGIILLHAMLLFIYTNLRETPVGGAIRRRLFLRLQDALDSCDMASQTRDFPAEMLWALFLGAFAATGTDLIYFRETIRSFRLNNQIHPFNQVTTLLENVPALRSTCLAKCMDVWEGSLI